MAVAAAVAVYNNPALLGSRVQHVSLQQHRAMRCGYSGATEQPLLVCGDGSWVMPCHSLPLRIQRKKIKI
jgi:hypothetical protein